MMRLLLFSILWVFSSCSYLPESVDVSYEPMEESKALAIATGTKVEVQVVDNRREGMAVSRKKGDYGVERASIKLSGDLASEVQGAVRMELKYLGCKIAPNAAVVEIEIQKFYNEFKEGFFGSRGVAELILGVHLKKPDGDIVYSKTIIGLGELSRFRAQFVDASTCSKLLHKLELEGFILLGKGERMNPGRGRTTILADLFEALFGAIYLDGGIEAARTFFHRHFEGDLLDSIRAPARNWKAELQDYAQKRYQKPPTYVVVKEFGPDHNKMFEVAVFLNDQEMGRGFGNSKKTAEQGAAEEAWKKLE